MSVSLTESVKGDNKVKLNEMEDRARLLGKIKLEPSMHTFGKIQTDEIILTNERRIHIMERHPQDYELFLEYGVLTVTQPDIIVKDEKNVGTVFMIKKLTDINISVVVRVALSTDKKELKNLVMTSYRLRDKNLKKMLERNEVLYKKE